MRSPRYLHVHSHRLGAYLSGIGTVRIRNLKSESLRSTCGSDMLPRVALQFRAKIEINRKKRQLSEIALNHSLHEELQNLGSIWTSSCKKSSWRPRRRDRKVPICTCWFCIHKWKTLCQVYGRLQSVTYQPQQFQTPWLAFD